MRGKIDIEGFIYIVLGLIFVIIPFDQLNHSMLYFLLYIIALVGIASFNKDYYRDVWFRYYLMYFGWCIIATLFSYDKILSARQLVAVLSPLFIYIALNELLLIDSRRFIQTMNNWMIRLSILLLVVLIICNLPFDNLLTHLFIYAAKDGSRIYLSTVSLSCLVYVLYFSQAKIIKFLTFLVVTISNLFYHDGAFWFILILLLVLYAIKLYRFKLIYVFAASLLSILLLSLTFFFVTKILHYNLHIQERFLVFEYWLPKLWYSPIYGIGLGLGQLHEFYVKKFPVDPVALQINPFIAFHAHNVFIDMALAIGFVGLFLFLLFLFKTIYTACKNYSYQACSYISILVVVLGKNSVDDLFEGSKALYLWLIIIVVYITMQNFEVKENNE